MTGKTVGGLRLYPHRNCLDRETALRLWTENVTWFSSEDGKKGRIEVGQFADLIVPDRDYFACAEDDIADTISVLTIVGGKVVYADGNFGTYEEVSGHRRCRTGRRCDGTVDMPRGASRRAADQPVPQQVAISCGCSTHCSVHGHDHGARGSADRRPPTQGLLGRARMRVLGGVKGRQ